MRVKKWTRAHAQCASRKIRLRCEYGTCVRVVCRHGRIVDGGHYRWRCQCRWGRSSRRMFIHPGMMYKNPVPVKRSKAMRKPKRPRRFKKK